MNHSASDSSLPESIRTSGNSSASSFARRIMRTGPDLRLINTTKTSLAERFSPGVRRRSVATIANLKKVMTYEDPSEEASEVAPAHPSALATPELKASANKPAWFRALRRQESNPEDSAEPSRPSHTSIPNASTRQSHFHSKSDALPRRSNVSTDDSHSACASSVGDLSNSSTDRQVKRSKPRPSFARWKSHSSHLLKHGKPQSSSHTSTPSESSVQTPASDFGDGHRPPSMASQQASLKTSRKRWLWRKPPTPRDSLSFTDVSNAVGMTPEITDARPFKFPKAASLSPQQFTSPQRETRSGCSNRWNGRETLELPPLPISPSDFDKAVLSSPGPRHDRRGASSYFAIREPSVSPSHSKHYGPDFIGTSLGGISPQSSSSATEEPAATESNSSRAPATSMPGERNEYFQADELPDREADVRRSLLVPEFVPPGQNRVHTPPEFTIDRAASGRNAGFFFAGPSSEGASKARRVSGATPARIRRKPRSSGLWDSDAVLMSQGVTADDEWNVPQGLSPDETPGIERDWVAERLDHILADSPQSRVEANRRDLAFEWDVPEHLPGSPLCPLHPKHKSGGKGMCVYHGRRKTRGGVDV
ncbi:rna polymerase ii accessory cdc73 [Diplodia corticola]|uniref:Rna polymerase ii accessory cdc73 n=1 Tax=Diplodia corticola TaxID=236234 RepID=A0A1J9RM45_9PEZI|nr:rna polymerase ii accessory cdc73 [Diplodia corticola]OJD29583.1 rna polymerase ii accessory cdc73 [Diplodia corticola]